MDAEEGSPQGWVYGVFWRHEAATGYARAIGNTQDSEAWDCDSPSAGFGYNAALVSGSLEVR